MVVKKFRHIYKVDAATDQFSLFKAFKTITVIANTVNIDSYCNVIRMESERCRQGNRIVPHVALVDNRIAGLNI